MARGQKRLSSDLELGGGGEDGGMGGEELIGEQGPSNPKRRLVLEILKCIQALSARRSLPLLMRKKQCIPALSARRKGPDGDSLYRCQRALTGDTGI